jgi:hypothetical protein
MAFTAVVLPQDLLERLRKDAAASDKGLSTEIRERLKLTYVLGGERIDPETDDLLAAIRLLARNLARDLGEKWHQQPYALAAFKAGVAAFLSRYQLEDHEGVRPDTRFSGEPNDPPEVVGRTHARLIAIGTHRDNEEDILE